MKYVHLEFIDGHQEDVWSRSSRETYPQGIGNRSELYEQAMMAAVVLMESQEEEIQFIEEFFHGE